MLIYASQTNPSVTEDCLNVSDTDLHELLKMGLIENLSIEQLSHIQSLLVTNIGQHEGDIVGISETGSGKTLSYLLPG